MAASDYLFGTLTKVEDVAAVGPIFLTHITVAGPAKYGTGGILGLKALLQAKTQDQRTPFEVSAVDKNGVIMFYDKPNDALMLFEAEDDTAKCDEIANDATSYAAVTFDLWVKSY